MSTEASTPPRPGSARRRTDVARQGEGDYERRSASWSLVHVRPAAHCLGQAADDRKPEPGSAHRASLGSLELGEALEHTVTLVDRNARAVVHHPDLSHVALHPPDDLDPAV